MGGIMLPNPILFGVVHMYGLMIAIGILGTFITLTFGGKKLGINEKFLDFTFFCGIGSIVIGFLSASLFQSVYNFIENPSGGFKFGQSMTFMGGLIGGVVCFLAIYFISRPKLPGRLMQILSLAPCCITIAHGFGRIGCFFAGCCYGIPAEGAFSFLGVSFAPGSSAYSRHGATPLHPTMLYEAAFLFIIFGIMLFLLMKYNFKHNMSVYLISYGIFRFLLEFIRGDHRGEFVDGISPSQFWSIPMVVLGIALIFVVNYFEGREKAKKA